MQERGAGGAVRGRGLGAGSGPGCFPPANSPLGDQSIIKSEKQREVVEEARS